MAKKVSPNQQKMRLHAKKNQQQKNQSRVTDSTSWQTTLFQPFSRNFTVDHFLRLSQNAIYRIRHQLKKFLKKMFFLWISKSIIQNWQKCDRISEKCFSLESLADSIIYLFSRAHRKKFWVLLKKRRNHFRFNPFD